MLLIEDESRVDLSEWKRKPFSTISTYPLSDSRTLLISMGFEYALLDLQTNSVVTTGKFPEKNHNCDSLPVEVNWIDVCSEDQIVYFSLNDSAVKVFDLMKKKVDREIRIDDMRVAPSMFQRSFSRYDRKSGVIYTAFFMESGEFNILAIDQDDRIEVIGSIKSLPEGGGMMIEYFKGCILFSMPGMTTEIAELFTIFDKKLTKIEVQVQKGDHLVTTGIADKSRVYFIFNTSSPNPESYIVFLTINWDTLTGGQTIDRHMTTDVTKRLKLIDRAQNRCVTICSFFDHITSTLWATTFSTIVCFRVEDGKDGPKVSMYPTEYQIPPLSTSTSLLKSNGVHFYTLDEKESKMVTKKYVLPNVRLFYMFLLKNSEYGTILNPDNMKDIIDLLA